MYAFVDKRQLPPLVPGWPVIGNSHRAISGDQ